MLVPRVLVREYLPTGLIQAVFIRIFLEVVTCYSFISQVDAGIFVRGSSFLHMSDTPIALPVASRGFSKPEAAHRTYCGDIAKKMGANAGRRSDFSGRR